MELGGEKKTLGCGDKEFSEQRNSIRKGLKKEPAYMMITRN